MSKPLFVQAVNVNTLAKNTLENYARTVDKDSMVKIALRVFSALKFESCLHEGWPARPSQFIAAWKFKQIKESEAQPLKGRPK